MASIKRRQVPLINLIPKDPFYETSLGKGMLWAIQVGRYIIVFTEIIVIMSFASRFKLDRDLTDLNTKVTQKQAIVQSYGDVEERTRIIQKKISLTKQLLTDSKAITVLRTTISKIPTGVQLDQLSYQTESVTLAGTAQTSAIFANLLLSLQQEPLYESVKVDKIASGTENDQGISFSIQLLLEKKAVTPSAAPVPTQTSEETPVL